jgi:hypothetical protein
MLANPPPLLCITHTVSHSHCVSLTLCVTHTVYHTHCVSLTLCVTHTVCHSHCVSLTLCVTHTVYHSHCVSLTLCITHTVYHSPIKASRRPMHMRTLRVSRRGVCLSRAVNSPPPCAVTTRHEHCMTLHSCQYMHRCQEPSNKSGQARPEPTHSHIHTHTHCMVFMPVHTSTHVKCSTGYTVKLAPSQRTRDMSITHTHTQRERERERNMRSAHDTKTPPARSSLQRPVTSVVCWRRVTPLTPTPQPAHTHTQTMKRPLLRRSSLLHVITRPWQTSTHLGRRWRVLTGPPRHL